MPIDRTRRQAHTVAMETTETTPGQWMFKANGADFYETDKGRVTAIFTKTGEVIFENAPKPDHYRVLMAVVTVWRIRFGR